MRGISSELGLQPRDFKLPASVNEQIFEEQIAPDQLHKLAPSANPQLTILMAQPGAGKTHVLDTVIKPVLFQEHGSFADLDSDNYKRYHPRYNELMKIDDTAMTSCTGEDARMWMRQAYRYVRENRVDVLTQEIVTNPPFLVNTVQSFREAGFGVNLIALAVPEGLSRQGILARYLSQVLASGKGRLTEPGKTTQSLEGMSTFVDVAHAEGMIDKITILNRAGEGESHDPKDFTVGALSETLDKARNRPLSAADTEQFAGVHAWLTKNLDASWEGELKLIHEIAKPLLDKTVVIES